VHHTEVQTVNAARKRKDLYDEPGIRMDEQWNLDVGCSRCASGGRRRKQAFVQEEIT
jgi:hypothetical protein